MPPTVEAITGSGGAHFFFDGGNSAHVRNSVGSLGRGLDVRASGGFVVAPPSLHVCGMYRWRSGREPTAVPFLPMPSWLHELLVTMQKPRSPQETRVVLLSDVIEGARNDRVTSLIGHLLARGIDPQVALELVLGWNVRRCRPPLDEQEVVGIVDSIAARELRRREGRIVS